MNTPTPPPTNTAGVIADLYVRIPRMWKAVYGGLFAGLVTLAALFVGDMTFDDISAAQWIAVVVAFVGGAGGTYAIPNRK